MNKLQLDGVNLWDTHFFTNASGMDSTEKLLYLYFLTNTFSNPCGIYKISNKRIAFDLDCTVTSVEGMLKTLRYHKQVYRFGPYIIIRDASLFINKPTKAIKTEWNKIIDKLPLKVKEKLVKIKYKSLDGKPFSLTNDKENTPLLFDKEELNNCFIQLTKQNKTIAVENKKDEIIKKYPIEPTPPKKPRKELIIEEEEDERKKELNIPTKETPQETPQEESTEKLTVEELIRIANAEMEEMEKETMDYEGYFESDNCLSTNEEVDIPYIENNSDAFCIDNEQITDERSDEDIFMDINCNSEDEITEHKIIQHLDELKDDRYYIECFQQDGIANFFIEKNKKILTTPYNITIESNAYLELFWNILEERKAYKYPDIPKFLSYAILEFLQLKGFYSLEFIRRFGLEFKGEGFSFISAFIHDEKACNRKFHCKKALKKMLYILYDFTTNGKDKDENNPTPLLQWYREHYRDEVIQNQKEMIKKLATA